MRLNPSFNKPKRINESSKFSEFAFHSLMLSCGSSRSGLASVGLSGEQGGSEAGRVRPLRQQEQPGQPEPWKVPPWADTRLGMGSGSGLARSHGQSSSPARSI